MKVLQSLARFVRAKDTDDERHEIREYATTHAEDLADAFDLPIAEFRTRLEAVTDDARLVELLLRTIKSAAADRRDLRATARVAAAQASADVLGSVASWSGRDRADLDVVSLLASCLTGRSGILICTCDAFTISVPMDRRRPADC